MVGHRRIAGLRAALAVAVVVAAAALAVVVAVPAAHAATLLSENFDDGVADGWSRSGGSWAVVTDGSLVYRQSGTSADAKAQVGSTTWTDYAVQARVKPTGFNGSARHVGVVARAQSMTSFYALALTNTGRLEIIKRASGSPVTLAGVAASVVTGSWYTLRLEASGSTLTGFLNGDTGRVGHRRRVRRRPGRAGHLLRERVVRRRPRGDGQRRATDRARRRPRRPARRRPGPAGSWASPPASPR